MNNDIIVESVNGNSFALDKVKFYASVITFERLVEISKVDGHDIISISDDVLYAICNSTSSYQHFLYTTEFNKI